jgi:hypothetical protein
VAGLPEKIDELTFGAGLAEHEDHWLQASGFTRLENCVQDKAGAVVKLPGFERFADTDFVNATGEAIAVDDIADFGGIPKLVSRAGQLAVCSNGYLFARADVGGEGWSLRGRCSPWVCERLPLIDCATAATSIYSVMLHDTCRSGDWLVTAFLYWAPGAAPANVQLAVSYTSVSTGVTLLQHVQALDSTNKLEGPLRAVPWDQSGAVLVVFGRASTHGTTGNLRYVKVTTSGFGAEATLSAGVSYFTDAAGTGYFWCFDVWSDGAGVGWVATCDSVSTGDVRMRRFTMGAGAAVVETNNQLVATAGIPVAVAIFKSAARVSVAYVQRAGVSSGGFQSWQVRAFARALTLGSSVYADTLLYEDADGSPTTPLDTPSVVGICQAQTAGGTDGDFVVFYDQNGVYGDDTPDPAPVTRGRFISTTPSLDASMTFLARERMCGKPFFDGTRVCWLSQHVQQTLQVGGTSRNHYYAVVGCEPRCGTAGAFRARPFAQVALETGNNVVIGTGGGDSAWAVLSSAFQDAAGAWYVTGGETDPGTLRQRLVAYKLVADDRVGCSAELGAATYLAGAMLSQWDGVRCIEAGWLTEPELHTIGVQAGTLSAGTRYYAMTWARTNAPGELLRSRPSPVQTATNTAANDNVPRWSPLSLTGVTRGDSMTVFAEIWRTKSGSPGPFYLVARIEQNLNDYTRQTWVDDNEDSAIPDIYGQTLPFEGAPGQEFANDPPICANSVTNWKNRLVITDGDQIAYSKEGLPSRQAEFSLLQTIPRASQQRLTAIAPLGDMLAVFGADSAGYVYGDGPAANGNGSTLTGPVMLQEPIGCLWPSGIVSLPGGGLIVPARGGLHSLSRKLEWSYLSAPVERTLEAFPRVRSAAVELGRDRVWFALTNAAASDGLFVVLDSLHNTWSVALRGLDPVSVLSVGDALYWTEPTGELNAGPDTDYLAAGAPYGMVVETPWMKPGGALAEIRFKRLWLLLETLSSSTLRIEVGYDFDDTYTHAVDFSVLELANLEGDPGSMLRMGAPRQRCHAFRLRITETDPQLEGFRFVAMRLLTALRGAKGALKGAANAGGGFTAT